MLSRAAARTTTSLVSRRGFHATRARLSSPYHYPEGAYTNLPFNPHSKWFGAGYWAFMATGFLAPFGIACKAQSPFRIETRFQHMLDLLFTNANDCQTVYQTQKSAA